MAKNNYTDAYIRSIAPEANDIIARLRRRDKRALRDGLRFAKTLEKTWYNVDDYIAGSATDIIWAMEEGISYDYDESSFSHAAHVMEQKLGGIYHRILGKRTVD